jgi:tetratricopeptide (TPR) repeat protein
MFPVRGKKRRLTPAADGDSIHTNLSLSLAEAGSGCTRQILLNRFISCDPCTGTGLEASSAPGSVSACSACHGQGRIMAESLLTVNLQPGLCSGSQVRLPCEGHAGICGGVAGELVIHIHVLPAPTLADDARGQRKLQAESTSAAQPDAAAPDLAEGQEHDDTDDSLILSPLTAELAAEQLLDDCCRTLHEMPEQTPCAVCGTATSELIVLSVQHRLFTCGIPISVCTQCGDRAPFSDADRPVVQGVFADLDGYWPEVAGFLCAGYLWLFARLVNPLGNVIGPTLLLFGVIIAILAIWGGHRLYAAWQRRYYGTSQAHLRALLRSAGMQPVFDDDQEAEVSLVSPLPRFQRPGSRPLDIGRQWLHLHQQCRVLFGESERQRAGVGRSLLDTLVREVLLLQQEFLEAAPADAAEAYSVGIVLLPGGRQELEVHCYSNARSIPELQAALRRSLLELPPVTVDCALPLMVYSCNRHGTPLQVRLPQPFQGWRKAQGAQNLSTTARPSELAEAIYGVQSEQRQLLTTAEHLHDWVDLGAPLLPLLSDECARLVQRHVEEPGNALPQQQLAALLQQFAKWYPEVPEIRFLHARSLGQMELPERAAAVCQELVQQFPQFGNAHGFLACLQYHLGRAEDAEVTLRAAPRSGLSIEFCLSVARLFRDLDQPGKAAGYLNAAILRHPCEAQIWIERAQLFAQTGNTVRALQDLDQFEQLSGVELQTIWLRGQWLLQLGQHDAALQLFEKAANQYPRNPLFLQLRAEALEEIGRSSEAVAETTKVLEQAPNFLPARLLRIHSLIKEGSLAEALTEIDNLPDDAGLASEQHLLRGMVLQQQGDFEDALWHFDQACAVDDRPILRCRRVEALWKLERLEEALAELNLLLTDLPEAAPLLVLRGRIQLRMGQPAQAAADFDRAIQLDPQNVDALQGRAVVFIDDRQPELAMSLLDAALRIEPADPNSLLTRARLFWEDHELQRAENDLTRLLDHAPDFIPAILFRAEVRLRQQQLTTALSDYNNVLLSEPENTAALIARSLLHELLNDPENARNDIDRATQLAPESTDSLTASRLMLQASLAFEDERYPEALEKAEEVLELQPETPHALRLRAAARWYLDQFVEALHDYDQLLLLPEQPDQPRTGLLISRAAVLGELGEFDQALEILHPAIADARTSRGRDLARGLNALGRTLTGLERFAEADEAFRESLSMEPENAWLHFNRGLFFVVQGQRLAAAKCFALALRLKRPPLSPRKRLQATGFIRLHEVEQGD